MGYQGIRNPYGYNGDLKGSKEMTPMKHKESYKQCVAELKELVPPGQAVGIDVLADQLDLPKRTIRQAIRWAQRQNDHSLVIELQKEMIGHI